MCNRSDLTTIETSNATRNGTNQENSSEALETNEDNSTTEIEQETSDGQEY